jgi:putative membrane protein
MSPSARALNLAVARRTRKRVMVGAFGGLWFVSCLSPPWPHELVLQHIPTVLAVVLLLTLDRHQPLSVATFAAVLAFLCLHLLGARYLYSNVPYEEWYHAILGHGKQPLAEWRRNHYDRLVHFFYGLLLVGVAYEVVETSISPPRIWAIAISIGAILASSALYELLEWWLALALAPEQAEAYNGQQGDMWDAQKDMALALAGAILGVLVVFIHRVTTKDVAAV